LQIFCPLLFACRRPLLQGVNINKSAWMRVLARPLDGHYGRFEAKPGMARTARRVNYGACREELMGVRRLL
jgi:hypothetical protein